MCLQVGGVLHTIAPSALSHVGRAFSYITLALPIEVKKSFINEKSFGNEKNLALTESPTTEQSVGNKKLLP